MDETNSAIRDEILSCCAYLEIQPHLARILAAMLEDRLFHRGRGGSSSHRAQRNERIRRDYNGTNAVEIGRREGVSVRTVRRVANGR